MTSFVRVGDCQLSPLGSVGCDGGGEEDGWKKADGDDERVVQG